VEDNILKEEAYNEIDSCCQTLCISSTVKEYILSLENKISVLEQKLLEKSSENIIRK
jgi:hypothetical protein